MASLNALASIHFSLEIAELLVYGFLRSCLNALNAPEDIINLCLKWYFVERDCWDLKRVPKEIEIKGDIATQVHETSLVEYSNVVGTTLISNATDKKEWKLKCTTAESTGGSGFYFVIGIVPDDWNNSVITDPLFEDGMGYGVDVFNGNGRNYKNLTAEIDPKVGDILTLTFMQSKEKSHGELYVGLNDEELIQLHNDVAISDGQLYKLCISFYANGEGLQLLQ